MNDQDKLNSKLFGMDVSAYQGNIDWLRIKQAAVSFVFIKATEGTTFVDKAYAHNIAGARAANIPCGAYHFFHPGKSVAKQVSNFVRTVGSLQTGDLQPVLDLEVPAEWSTIPHAKRIELVTDWIEGVKSELDVEPIIYLSSSFAGDVLGDAKQLSNYPLWLAHYTKVAKPTVPSPWSFWSFWQYTDKGTIDGINGSVDMNRFNGSTEQLQLFRKKF